MIDAMRLAQCKLWYLEQNAKVQLEVVEGDTNLADLQGFLTGVEVVKTKLLEADYELEPLPSDFVDLKIVELDEDNIMILASQVQAKIYGTEEWNKFNELLSSEVQKKKDFLYNDAKKGRDLAFVQGWKKAVEYIEECFDDIVRIDEINKEKGQTFNFTDDKVNE